MANLAYIQVCRICNQECRFCSNPSTDRTIPLGKAKKLIDLYIEKGYEGVILSGGEPTMYPDLGELIKYARGKKFPARIITNGQKTSDFSYAKSLVDSGLIHIQVSMYSDNRSIQAYLTKNPDSLQNIKKTLDNFQGLNIRLDVSSVINKYNADHLSKIAKWIVHRYPFVDHFIWNNLDPFMNQASKNSDTIPRLVDFETELHRAMVFLSENKKTFRVERVPLCYMPEFAEFSTEARKIIKNEKRAIFFLDKKGLILQKGWAYGKAKCCDSCSLTLICPGLYSIDQYFFSKELYPVFVSMEEIKKRVLSRLAEDPAS